MQRGQFGDLKGRGDSTRTIGGDFLALGPSVLVRFRPRSLIEAREAETFQKRC